MDRPEVSIIGTGALGSTLAEALFKKDVSIKSIFNRSPEHAFNLVEQTHATYSGAFPSSKSELGSLIFITVSDDAVEEVASRLASIADSYNGHTIAHCSGNKTASALSSLAEKGAQVVAFHPLQTFTAKAVPQDFEGIIFDIQGDPKAVGLMADIADQLGARWFEITADQKPWLHASAVMASNYLIALLDAAGKIAASGGMDEQQIRKALLPLVTHSLENATAEDLSEVLTGPVARRDLETIKNHLEILEKKPSLFALYKQLGQIALSIAQDKETVSSETEQALKKLFETNC